ncbi:apses-type HTH transcription regulator [Mucor lusitanicus CBS 277.49]|uniref:Apses-type HTH transcription regulator n=2 Tax=Mucor circinelloides f. lusitanicus TaxID=29924 RepID=A0A162TFE3_MUCCL|nr:apses-type HTH transcription regulator [Mucor lusitanicus CBS 277.49]
MDNLYQSPPYSYLPPATHANDYHHHHTPQPNMYRSSHSFDRPFNGMVNDHHADATFDYYHHHHHHYQHPPFPSSSPYGGYNNSSSNVVIPSPRPKVTTNVWEDEGTNCFQVDAKGICVARRQDNDMINGTKLLNVVGMSRGKRDGILKNEKGRVVVKVGAMHLKGVWIPFERARELAAKFKILDVLFPLFADEPSIYLCSPPIGGAAQLDSSEMMPSPNVSVNATAAVNKCNIVSSPLPAFNRSDEYNHNGGGGASPVGIPNWDRPSYNGAASFSSSHYDNHHHPQQQTALHRASLPDLNLANSSPVPRSNHIQHPPYHHHQQQQEENDLYLLNQNQSNNHNSNPYDYYHRQFSNNDNRGSFSSVSSHHSLLYPSLQQQQHHEEEASKNSSVTTPTSYTFDYNNGRFNNDKMSYPSSLANNNNIGSSSPYTKPTSLLASTTTTTHDSTTDMSHPPPPPVARTGSAGSTTPSSWFSPETPTAVVFQQKDKEDASISKKRKSSLSIEPNTLKRRSSILSPTSPGIRATRRVKVEHSTED